MLVFTYSLIFSVWRLCLAIAQSLTRKRPFAEGVGPLGSREPFGGGGRGGG